MKINEFPRRIAKTVWPPTKSIRLSLCWALLLGFVLSIALPLILAVTGFKDAALFAIYPGLFPIIVATGGWFAGISVVGYLLMFSINTLVYGLLVMVAFQTRRCFRANC